MQKNKIINALTYIYAAVFPFLMYLTFETLNTTSRAISFPPIVKDLPVVFISGLALLFIMMIFYSLIGNLLAAAFAVTLFTGVIYVVNYYRLILTGWVFVPAELALFSQVANISSFAKIHIYPVAVAAALMALAELAVLFPASLKFRHTLKERMLILDVFLALTLFLFCSSFAKGVVLPKFNIDTSRSVSINRAYRANGVLMGFYQSYFYVANEQPADYDEETLTQLADAVDNSSAYRPNSLKPNVIVIMSEAFIDPSVLPNITFSEDPAPNVRALRESFTSGSMLSPAFGGATCNPEYEFLTGNAFAFASYAGMPYENEAVFIPKNDPRSLPQMFRDNGYKTVSVHPYDKDFFNRSTIYPKLGFDKSIFLEDMEEPVEKGLFVSDEYFTDVILNEINEADEPLFLYGISMQNHYGYFKEKYKEYDITAESDRLDEFQSGSADAYLQGVRDADIQLARLIDEISKSGRPTVVLFFGDHLPLLGESAFSVYHALDYIENESIETFTNEEMYKMFTTPYVLWNNFGLEKEDWGNVNAFYLGALAAKSAGIELNVYYQFLLQAHDVFHGIKENLFIDADGELHTKPTPDAQKTIAAFQAFQYDKIFGKGYIDDTLSQY